MPRLPRAAALCLALLLPACSEFPELAESASPDVRRAAYPDLVPVEDIKAGLSTPRITDTTTLSLEARVARLRARAARLRGTVIDQTSRQRLDHKISIDVPK